MAKTQEARKRKHASRNGSSGRGNGADIARLNGKSKHKSVDETPVWQKTLGALVLISAVLATAFLTGVIRIDRNIVDTDEAQDPIQEAQPTVAEINDSKSNKTTSKYTQKEPSTNQASQQTSEESKLRDKTHKDEANMSAKDAKVESRSKDKKEEVPVQRSQESKTDIPAKANATKKKRDKLDIPEATIDEEKKVKEKDEQREDKAKVRTQERSSKENKKKDDKMEVTAEDAQKEDSFKKGREEKVEPSQGARKTENIAKTSKAKESTVQETDSPKGKMVTPKRTPKNEQKSKDPKNNQPPSKDVETNPGEASMQTQTRGDGRAEVPSKSDDKARRNEDKTASDRYESESDAKQDASKKDKKAEEAVKRKFADEDAVKSPPQQEKIQPEGKRTVQDGDKSKDKKKAKDLSQKDSVKKSVDHVKNKKVPVLKKTETIQSKESENKKVEVDPEKMKEKVHQEKEKNDQSVPVNKDSSSSEETKHKAKDSTPPKDSPSSSPSSKKSSEPIPDEKRTRKSKELPEQKSDKVVQAQSHTLPKDEKRTRKSKEPSEQKSEKVVQAQSDTLPKDRSSEKPEEDTKTKPIKESPTKSTFSKDGPSKKVAQDQKVASPEPPSSDNTKDSPNTKNKTKSTVDPELPIKERPTKSTPSKDRPNNKVAQDLKDSSPQPPSIDNTKDSPKTKTKTKSTEDPELPIKESSPKSTAPKDGPSKKVAQDLKDSSPQPPSIDNTKDGPKTKTKTKSTVDTELPIKESPTKSIPSKDRQSKKVAQDLKDTNPQPPSSDNTKNSPKTKTKTKSTVDPELPPSTPPPSQSRDSPKDADVAKATSDANSGGGRDKAAADNVGDVSRKTESKTPVDKKPNEKKLADKNPVSVLNALLEEAQNLVQKRKTDQAVYKYEDIIKRFPNSAKALMEKAKLLDKMAEDRRSNDLLENAIQSYRQAADIPTCPRDIHKAALSRMADRLSFFGKALKSIRVYQELVREYPDDYEAKKNLAVQHLIMGANEKAKPYFEQMLEINPMDGFALVHMGFILKTDGNYQEAIPFLRAGIDTGDRGTNEGKFFFQLGESFLRIGEIDESYKVYDEAVSRGHFRSRYQRSLYNVDSLRGKPFWTPKDAGYTEAAKKLERNWETIRDEALALLGTDGFFKNEEEKLKDTGDWKQFTLFAQGNKQEANCRQAPRTCKIFENIPESSGCKRGQVKFSVMHPGTHVWPHCGPTNCRLRSHLGLVIPQPVRLRVGNITRSWDEGKVFIFDDSFEHEVWQDADSLRLVLIADLWHPDLSESEKRRLSPI